MLNIQKTVEEKSITIALEGRLDTVTAPELEQEIKASLDGVKTLLLDFSRLEYISSAGLRLLLSAHKAQSGNGGMKVCHVSDSIMEILEVTGFSEILTIV